MSSSLKISADTSQVKQSILELSKSLKSLGDSKISIFTAEDKKFMKGEISKELSVVKTRLKENIQEIKKMTEEQRKMVKGANEELEVRKKIMELYRNQNKLAKEASTLQQGQSSIGGSGGGGLNLMSLLGGAAAALGGAVLLKGIQSTNQYVGGTGNRNRLKGLGVNDDNFGNANDLAKSGLTEQDLIKRRIDATSILGRQGTSNQTEIQKASFERAYGLQGGTMTGVAGSLRSTMGGAGANDAQVKLQSTIMASGLEDALGPYLETMTSLLTSINENGTTNTNDVMSLMARLTKDGSRTPEQMGKTFSGVNSAMQNSSGEANAFLQTAFARAGIGGGTIGGTKFALSSGGLFGMNQGELAKRGYNPELLKNMGGAGMFSGIGKRTDAMMDLFKQSGGLGRGESISGIKDVNKMVGMGNMANSVFGTKGNQGFDALMMLEKVQNKQMSSKDFDEQIKKMTESKDPQVERLDKINASLSGQTELLTNIDTNLSEALGKQGVTARNALKKLENQGTQGAISDMTAINGTGVVQGAGNAMQSAGGYMFGGQPGKRMLGDDLYDIMDKAHMPTAKEIGDAVAKAIKNLTIGAPNVNVRNTIMVPQYLKDKTGR